MSGMDVIGNVGLVTGVLTLIGSVAVARIQARGSATQRSDERISALEAAVSRGNDDLAAAREKHLQTVERLMEEEEEMRDRHAAKLLVARERMDDQRVQLTAMRAELLRRGINPDRLLGEAVAA
jgi:biopolymer transport protein ExbB/TolQ